MRQGPAWIAQNEGDGLAVCRELRAFLIQGKKTTDQLLNKFKGRTKDALTFREILQEMAEIGSDSKWVLRSEFR